MGNEASTLYQAYGSGRVEEPPYVPRPKSPLRHFIKRFVVQVAYFAIVIKLLYLYLFNQKGDWWIYDHFLTTPTSKVLHDAALEGWIRMCIYAPMVMQMYIWFIWRLELCFQGLSKLFFGSKKVAFAFYTLGFLFVSLSRAFSIIALILMTKNTLVEVTEFYCNVTGGVLVLLAVATMVGTFKQLSFGRVVGRDHFFPEECHLKGMVKDGVFNVVSHPIYTFIPLLPLGVALIFRSKLGLILATYNYFSVWVHHFCTESPDMEVIYGSDTDAEKKE